MASGLTAVMLAKIPVVHGSLAEIFIFGAPTAYGADWVLALLIGLGAVGVWWSRSRSWRGADRPVGAVWVWL